MNECWSPSGLDARTAQCPYQVLPVFLFLFSCLGTTPPHAAVASHYPPWPSAFPVGGLDIWQGALLLSGAIS